MTTTITSEFGKTVTINKFNQRSGHAPVAQIKVTSWGYLHPEGLASDALFKPSDILDALKAEGLLNGEFITDLPEAKEDSYGDLQAGAYWRSGTTDPESVMRNAKALLAIHAGLVKKQEELKAKEAEVEAQRIKEAAAKAEAEKRAIAKRDKRRDKRRDELATEFSGYYSYKALGNISQKAIDRIVELEEAQA